MSEHGPPGRARSIPRRLLALLGKVLLFCAITFAIGEAASRWIMGIRPLHPAYDVFTHHPRWGWHHVPDGEVVFVKLGVEQPIRINSKGLRERELPYRSDPDVFRVLVVGDSAVVGFEVPPEAVFTRVAERALRDRGHAVEFINGGTRGWGTDQAYLFIADEGLKYEPDLVLYWFNGNDLDDNMTIHRPFRVYGKPYFGIRADGTAELRGTPVPRFEYTANIRLDTSGNRRELTVPWKTRFVLWIRDEIVCRSGFATALVHIVAAAPQLTQQILRAGSYGDFEDLVDVPDPESYVFRLTASLVEAMRRAAEAEGAAFDVLMTDGPWSLLLGRELGVQDFGTYARWKERIPSQAEIRIPFDPHWNALGHRIYGEALAEGLVESGLLPPPAGTESPVAFR